MGFLFSKNFFLKISKKKNHFIFQTAFLLLKMLSRGLQLMSNVSRARRSLSMSMISMDEQKDLVVIGGGPGGYVAAIQAAQMGMKVTCVEGRGTLGGTCLNVGCIPSKALLHTSHLYEEANHDFAKRGIVVEGTISIDVAKLQKSKEKSVRGLTSGIEFLFKKNGVEYVKGWGRIEDGGARVSVSGDDGQQVASLGAKNVLIASGSEVMPLPGIEIDEVDIVSSTGALALSEVPETMVVIGGGVIGLELGSVWRRLGAKVTVVEFLPSIAAGADAQMAKAFEKVLKSQGVEFKLNAKVVGAKKTDAGVELTVEPAKGGPAETIVADKVLVSIGRRPYTEGLGLAEAGIDVDERGRVQIDDHFRTSVPSVRAIGDVVRGAMLAHKAEEEGIAAVENIANPKAGHVNYGAIPSVVYTSPELAWVGLTEEQCKEQGIKYNVGTFPFQANSRARTNDNFHKEELVKIISDENDRVLGVHILNGQAGELIQEAVLALEYGASCEDIARTCHAHPTLSEAIKEAARVASPSAFGGHAIHF
jgi:dihydrolipoyl dehydrogenase